MTNASTNYQTTGETWF